MVGAGTEGRKGWVEGKVHSAGNSIVSCSMEINQLVWIVKVVCMNWLPAHYELDGDQLAHSKHSTKQQMAI